MSSTPSKLERPLRRFFSPPNRLWLDRIEEAEDDRGLGRFQRWISPLRLSEPSATLLPCQRDPKGPVDWYAVAFTDRELRTLGEELSAFVGPSYSYFRGERARLDASDPVEAAVLEMSEGRAFRVTAPPHTKAQAGLWDALERMRRVRARRQEREPEVLRPAGRLLRDFFLALRAGNRDGAEDLLRLLRDRYEFGTWNLLFLRVQMLSDLGRWEELLSLPQMGDLLRIRRPLAVTEALLTGIYHVELEPFEFRDDPTGAVEHFAREVYPRYAQLYTYRTGMRSPEVLKSFLLLAVSHDEPDLSLRDEILATARLPVSERRYLERLAELAPQPADPPAAVDVLASAREGWAQGRYDVAFGLASAAPPSLERARILLQCAYEMPALEVHGAAIQAVEALTEEDRQQLLGSRWARDFWDDLVGPEEDEVVELPSGWIQWLERLDAGWDEHSAVDVARQGADQWEVDSLLEVPSGVMRVADGLMAGRSAEGESAVRNALPHLLAFAQRDPEWPRRDLLPLYNSLLFLLAATERGGRDELNLFNELFSALLSLGMDTDGYGEAVNWGIELWDRYAAPKNIDWVLDLLDLLVDYPAPDKEVRLRLLQAIASSFQQFTAQGRAIQPQQWLLFRKRCSEMGHPELSAVAPGPDDRDADGAAAEDIGFDDLAGRSVALYTLTESVGRRVATLLKDLCPTVTVEVSHEKVCTERLRAAAKNADIFVMVTMSAKHAATGCIEANRPKALPLLRPMGKGSASMLTALTTFLMGVG